MNTPPIYDASWWAVLELLGAYGLFVAFAVLGLAVIIAAGFQWWRRCRECACACGHRWLCTTCELRMDLELPCSRYTTDGEAR